MEVITTVRPQADRESRPNAGAPTEELLRAWYDADEPRLGGVTSMPVPPEEERVCPVGPMGELLYFWRWK
jgi:hypothetical protein